MCRPAVKSYQFQYTTDYDRRVPTFPCLWNGGRSEHRALPHCSSSSSKGQQGNNDTSTIISLRLGMRATTLILSALCSFVHAAAPAGPPPSAPPKPSLPPLPPPAYVTCGCTRYENGATAADAGFCVKFAGTDAVCRTLSSTNCPSDMTTCAPSVVSGCSDSNVGKWKTKKCRRKLRKGKCHKKRVAANCRLSCGTCSVG